MLWVGNNHHVHPLRRIRPYFWTQPQARPYTTTPQLMTQPSQTDTKHAREPRALGCLWRWWCSHARWFHTDFVGIFYSRSRCQRPQCCHRHDQPVAFNSPWVASACMLPFPAHTFERSKSQLNPHPQRVPTRPDPMRRQVAHHHPRVLLTFPPDCRQCHRQSWLLGGAQSSSSNPPLSWLTRLRLA